MHDCIIHNYRKGGTFHDTSHKNNCRAKLRYHRVRGLYFVAVVFAATVIRYTPCIVCTMQYTLYTIHATIKTRYKTLIIPRIIVDGHLQ